MLHSFLTNFFNQKSPTQKFCLHTGLENILSIFSPIPIMNYWYSCPARICRESQNKTTANRLIYGFLKSGVTHLDRRWPRKESPHWQMLLAEGLMRSPEHLLYSFPALIFLIKLSEHQFCLYQCFHSALGFVFFKLCNTVTAPVI